MAQAYIFDAVRTPRGRGKKDGGLHQVTPVQLSTTCFKAIRERNDLDTSLVEDVVLGCTGPIGEQGANIGRITALNAGYDEVTAGAHIDRYCGSGLDAINMMAACIMAGQIEMGIGGGVESMSRIPMGSSGGAWVLDPDVAWRTNFVPQGVSADLLATKYGYSRQELDALAVESQQRAYTAQSKGYFNKSIVPVTDLNGLIILDKDEYLRPETTVEDLAALQPSFEIQGSQFGLNGVAMLRYPEVEKIIHVHHPGNSSGIVDGASAVLLGSKDAGEKSGIKPRATVRSWANVGVESSMMLHGPWPATQKALKNAGMSVSDIDLCEMNEAFASPTLHLIRESGLSPDRVNVNGGAIALGHPLGATGGVLIGTLLDELERRDQSVGLVTMCMGAGMGIATIIERI